MNYHLFVLVWGKDFVNDFTDLAVPFLMAPGNLPSLSENHSVNLHIYTDTESIPLFSESAEQIRHLAKVTYHDAAEAALKARAEQLSAPGPTDAGNKYDLQNACLADLVGRLDATEDSVVVAMESGFILADGALLSIAEKLDNGHSAVMVDILRLSRDRCRAPLFALLSEGIGRRGPRALLHRTIAHLHQSTEERLVSADTFSAYPSQLFWRVGATDLLARSFIPHPLAFRLSPGIGLNHRSIDGDLAFKYWQDEEATLVTDSDDIFVAQLCSDVPLDENRNRATADPKDLALFAISCTHQRHRRFAEQSIRYHVGERTGDWVAYESAAKSLIDATYAEVDRIVDSAGRLDSSLLKHLKSYSRPIETFLSPPPSALRVEPLRGGDGRAI